MAAVDAPIVPAGLLPADAVRSSVTRIARLEEAEVVELSRDRWETGDYVACVVDDHVARAYEIESASGRLVEVIAGDIVVGALGMRSATLEAVGDWQSVGPDGRMAALTRAGILGRVLSAAPVVHDALVPLLYAGHVHVGGVKARMDDFVVRAERPAEPAPVVLLIGTSMSAGKTTTAVTAIRRLRRHGLRVAGTKVTGVARYGDILKMRDAGAAPVVDFVDAGLPSSICPPERYRTALEHMLAHLERGGPDVIVAECGASPIEPYNVDLAVEMLHAQVRCTILCASDPFAVLGVARAFDISPDLIAGRATSTTAGVALVERLTGATALNLLDVDTHPQLDELLLGCLGL